MFREAALRDYSSSSAQVFDTPNIKSISEQENNQGEFHSLALLH